MTHVPKPGAPITIERVERALNKCAEIIVFMGKGGEKIMPIYESVERELADMKARESKMKEIRERAARSKDLRKKKKNPWKTIRPDTRDFAFAYIVEPNPSAVAPW